MVLLYITRVSRNGKLVTSSGSSENRFRERSVSEKNRRTYKMNNRNRKEKSISYHFVNHSKHSFSFITQPWTAMCPRRCVIG